MSKRYTLLCSESCILTERQEPYAVIECKTQEDFLFLQNAIALYKQMNPAPNKSQPLSLEGLLNRVGTTVYVDVTWGTSNTYQGPALISKAWPEGFRLDYNGTQHFLLNKWYGQSSGWHWIAYPYTE